MNDRFKFRFYHYETETMYEVKAICFDGRPIVTVQYNPVLKFPLDSGELMQCADFKDKPGKLVYEGDIISDYDDFKFLVRWDSLELEYVFIPLENTTEDLDIYLNECEIVGNIYENEEFTFMRTFMRTWSLRNGIWSSRDE